MAGYTFRPPPGWPSPPPGWVPPSGWHPDPDWPVAPADWQFYAELPFVRGNWDLDKRTKSEAEEQDHTLGALSMTPRTLPNTAGKREANWFLRTALGCFVLLICVFGYIGMEPDRDVSIPLLILVFSLGLIFLIAMVLGMSRPLGRRLTRAGQAAGVRAAAREDATSAKTSQFLAKATLRDDIGVISENIPTNETPRRAP